MAFPVCAFPNREFAARSGASGQASRAVARRARVARALQCGPDMRVAASSLLLLLGACGSKDLLADLPDAGPTAVDAGPAGCYPIFLNRAPVTIYPSTDGLSDPVANKSVMVTETVTTAGSQLSDSDWDATVACVRALFAPFPVVITEVDPGDVDHHEVVVTHSATEIGGPSGATAAWSGIGCGTQRRELTFAFSAVLTSPRELCERGVGAVAGGVAGLDGSTYCPDVMSLPSSACGDKSFVDAEVACAAPLPCRCGGDTQNSYQTMQDYYAGLCDG
jgi:hypothetical protein